MQHPSHLPSPSCSCSSLSGLQVPSACEQTQSSPEPSLHHVIAVNTSVAVAGSLGVRGLIEDVQTKDRRDGSLAIKEALSTLRQHGIRRAHIFVQEDDHLRDAALAAGFQTRPGETLFQRAITERPHTSHINTYPFLLRNGTPEDLISLVKRVPEMPELAFEQWEFPVIFSNLEKHDRFFKVLELDGHIVGGSIGGASGIRGTISHLWVDREHRKHGLGHLLSDASLQALYDMGARHAHLMTVSGNVGADTFWRHQGFQEATETEFLEIDI
jgi:GNAT superfamily N-acetyltransferase